MVVIINSNSGDGNGDGDGDGDGDSDGRMANGGDGWRFLGIANLIEVRKANRQVENVLHCTYTAYYSDK